MTDQNTKVTYTAVSRFTDLYKDLDGVLARIEAIEAAEKRLGKLGQKNKASIGTSSTSSNSNKSVEANEARRIKRLDAAQRVQAARELRAEKSRAAAQERRAKKLDAATKAQLAQELRAEKEKDAAQRKRLTQEKADLRNRLADEASLRKAMRDDELAGYRTATRTNEAIKLEGTKERLRQERNARREQEASDKKRAAELARQLVAARRALDTANSRAGAGNRFTRNPVATRQVGSVSTNYDADRDANYFQAVSRAREQELALIKRSTEAVNKDVDARGKLFNILAKMPSASDRAGNSLGKSLRNSNRDIRNTNTLLGQTLRNLDQIGRWRPRLIPPFIALVPIIASLLALMNPLVAGLGAVGAAAFGLASSLASLAGAALGAVPALATLLSVAAALKMAFGGVGKALSAANKLGTGGGGGAAADRKEELTYAEKIARAQEKYRRSIEDVQLATEDLDNAKKDYIKRLKEVEKQVNRVRTAEARAAANAQLAVEEYYNVMADPGSTKGQKMDALVNMDEAKQDLEDVRNEVGELQNELAEMRRKGINGDDAVRAASRRLTDAIWAQRDAQLDLANAYRDTGNAASGGSSGVDKFNDALEKLSPSAQAVVLALLAMKPAWEDVQRSVQESFFSEIVTDVSKLVRLFPVLESLLGKTAGALGRVASRSIDLVTSDKWLRDLTILGEQNVPIIENIGDALLYVADAFMDIAVAAGPFTVALTEGLKEGADNFRDLVASARETGALASWLEKVNTRLSQWWRIVKNVGATLFNYGAASESFGTWITQGLEDVTAGWRRASEEAREAGSSWQKYLEDIKPALTSLKNMFATFFQWFGREAANPKNIAAFTRIIDTITNELGPALARIFDALSETGVGESLIDALVTIAETIANFLEKGGAEGIKAFFDTINNLFQTFSDIIDQLPEDVLAGIATTLMTISALRFFGITKLITSLISLIATGKLKDLATMFGSMSKAGKTGGGGVTPVAGTPVTAGKHGVPATGVAGTAGKTTAPKISPIKGKILPILGKAGVIGAIAASVVETGVTGVDLISTMTNQNSTTKDKVSSNTDFLTSGIFKATPGASLAGAGMDIGEFFGLDVDAWLTETLETIGLWFINLPENLASLGIDIWGAFGDFGIWLEEQWNNVVTWFEELPYNAGVLVGSLWGEFLNFGDWLAEQWNNVLTWFEELPYNVGVAVGVLWGNLQNFGDWLAEQWNNAILWFEELPQKIADTASDVWANIKTFGAWLGEQWDNAVAWFQNLPASIESVTKDVWRNIKTFGAWLGEQWTNAVNWFRDLPTKVKNTAQDIWKNLPSLWSWVNSAWNGAKSFFSDLPNKVANTVGDIWRNISKTFTAGVNVGVSTTRKTGFTGGVASHQGIQRFFNGGQAAVVPGVRSNSDTVPAMLTPGEVIFSKMAVARAGGAQNLLDFNYGKISFGEMMMKSAFSGVQGFNTGGEVGAVPSITSNSEAPVTDNRIIIENLEINNPTGQTSGDSIAQTVRDVTYLRGR
jgi:hypothetical protein